MWNRKLHQYKPLVCSFYSDSQSPLRQQTRHIEWAAESTDTLQPIRYVPDHITIQMAILWTLDRLWPCGLRSYKLWRVHCHHVKSARAYIYIKLLIDEPKEHNNEMHFITSRAGLPTAGTPDVSSKRKTILIKGIIIWICGKNDLQIESLIITSFFFFWIWTRLWAGRESMGMGLTTWKYKDF